MKAIVISILTGEVLAEFNGDQLVDAMSSTSFFRMQKEEAERNWARLWRGVRGGEIREITPRKDDSYELQVSNDSIEWR